MPGGGSRTNGTKYFEERVRLQYSIVRAMKDFDSNLAHRSSSGVGGVTGNIRRGLERLSLAQAPKKGAEDLGLVNGGRYPNVSVDALISQS